MTFLLHHIIHHYQTISFGCDADDGHHVDDVFRADAYDVCDVLLFFFYSFSPVTTTLLYHQKG
jgi:hypothetical protein